MNQWCFNMFWPSTSLSFILFSIIFSISFAPSSISDVWALRQPNDLLSYVQDFQNAYTYPSINQITEQIIWDGFNPGVKGRIDVTNEYDGAELNTEYIFGLFATQAVINSTRLLPIPVTASNLSEAAIQGNVGSVSFIATYDFGQGIGTWPIQIDFWVRFDDEGRMLQYDLTFRRFAWFWTNAMPYALPFIARDADMNFQVTGGASSDGRTISLVNGTFRGGDGGNENLSSYQLIQRRAAVDICRTHEQYCVGKDQQYSDTADCLNSLRHVKQLGNPWEWGQDTVMCRYVHRGMVQYRPDVHCEHIGPSGGDMCISRDYTDTVNIIPYNWTFSAPEDFSLPSRYADLPEHTLLELSSLATQVNNDLTITAFALNAVVFFFGLWLATIFIHFLLSVMFDPDRYSKGLTGAQKRNCISYVLNTVVTAGFFAVQGWSCSKVLTEDFTRDTVNGARVVALGVCLLYLFEMVYRSGMRETLLSHHIFTIFISCFTDAIVVKTNDPSYAITGLVWLYQATTEQSVFLGLLFYRLKFRSRKLVYFLRFAAIQSFITKLASTIYVLVWWIIAERKNTRSISIAYSVFLVITVVALLGVQFWGTWVVWTISRKAAIPLEHHEKSFRRRDEEAKGALAMKEIPRLARLAKKPSKVSRLSGTTLLALESRRSAKGRQSLNKSPIPPVPAMPHVSEKRSDTTVVVPLGDTPDSSSSKGSIHNRGSGMSLEGTNSTGHQTLEATHVQTDSVPTWTEPPKDDSNVTNAPSSEGATPTQLQQRPTNLSIDVSVPASPNPREPEPQSATSQRSQKSRKSPKSPKSPFSLRSLRSPMSPAADSTYHEAPEASPNLARAVSAQDSRKSTDAPGDSSRRFPTTPNESETENLIFGDRPPPPQRKDSMNSNMTQRSIAGSIAAITRKATHLFDGEAATRQEIGDVDGHWVAPGVSKTPLVQSPEGSPQGSPVASRSPSPSPTIQKDKLKPPPGEGSQS